MSQCSLFQEQLESIKTDLSKAQQLTEQLSFTGQAQYAKELQLLVKSMTTRRQEYSSEFKQKVIELMREWCPYINEDAKNQFIKDLEVGEDGRIVYKRKLYLKETTCTFIPALFKEIHQLEIPQTVTEINGLEKSDYIHSNRSPILHLPRLKSCGKLIVHQTADIDLSQLEEGALTIRGDTLKKLDLPVYKNGSIETNALSINAPHFVEGQVTLLGDIDEAVFTSLEDCDRFQSIGRIKKLSIPRVTNGTFIIRHADEIDMSETEEITGKVRIMNTEKLNAPRLQRIKGQFNVTDIQTGKIREFFPALVEAGGDPEGKASFIYREDQKAEIEKMKQEGFTINGMVWQADPFPGTDYDILLESVLKQLKQNEGHTIVLSHDIAKMALLRADKIFDNTHMEQPVTQKIGFIPQSIPLRPEHFELLDLDNQNRYSRNIYFYNYPADKGLYAPEAVLNYSNLDKAPIPEDVFYAEINGSQYPVPRPEMFLKDFKDDYSLADQMALKYPEFDADVLVDMLTTVHNISEKLDLLAAKIRMNGNPSRGLEHMSQKLTVALQNRLVQNNIPPEYLDKPLKFLFDCFTFIKRDENSEDIYHTLGTEILKRTNDIFSMADHILQLSAAYYIRPLKQKFPGQSEEIKQLSLFFVETMTDNQDLIPSEVFDFIERAIRQGNTLEDIKLKFLDLIQNSR